MAVLLSTKAHTMEWWKRSLLAVDPTLDIRMFPEAGDPADIEAEWGRGSAERVGAGLLIRVWVA